MTRFRYDAVLRVEADPAPSACLDEISEDWRVTAPNAEAIRERLASTQPSYFGLRHVANARLATENRIAQWLAGDFGIDTVGDLRRAQERAPPGGIDPEALWDLANTTGYDVEIRCEPESSGGDLAVLFSRRGSRSVDIDAALATPPRPFADCANNPLHEKLARTLVRECAAISRPPCRNI